MSLFVRSAEASLIEAELKQASVGEVVPYERLNSIVGRDVRKQCKGAITTARKTLARDGIWFDCETNIGLKRLGSSGIATAVKGRIARSRRAATRALDMSKAVVLDDLQPNESKELIASVAQLQAIELFATPSSRAKIASAVNDGTVSIGDTLKLFQ